MGISIVLKWWLVFQQLENAHAWVIPVDQCFQKHMLIYHTCSFFMSITFCTFLSCVEQTRTVLCPFYECPAKQGMKWVDDSSSISLFLKGILLLDIMQSSAFLKPTHLVLVPLQKWLYFPKALLGVVNVHHQTADFLNGIYWCWLCWCFSCCCLNAGCRSYVSWKQKSISNENGSEGRREKQNDEQESGIFPHKVCPVGVCVLPFHRICEIPTVSQNLRIPVSWRRKLRHSGHGRNCSSSSDLPPISWNTLFNSTQNLGNYSYLPTPRSQTICPQPSQACVFWRVWHTYLVSWQF